MNEGDKVPDEGKLTFRGYSIYDLVGGDATKRRGFEEIVYLLLMGELPTSSQLDVLVEHLMLSAICPMASPLRRS